MLGRTPPCAMVTRPSSLLSSSSLRMANCRWRGIICLLVVAPRCPPALGSQPPGTPTRLPDRQARQHPHAQNSYLCGAADALGPQEIAQVREERDFAARLTALFASAGHLPTTHNNKIKPKNRTPTNKFTVSRESLYSLGGMLAPPDWLVMVTNQKRKSPFPLICICLFQ